MPLSPAAKRLVSFVRGIPADRKEEIGKTFDAKHKKIMAKHENEYLAQAAAELSQIDFKERKDDGKKKKKKIKEDLNSIIDDFINEIVEPPSKPKGYDEPKPKSTEIVTPETEMLKDKDPEIRERFKHIKIGVSYEEPKKKK